MNGLIQKTINELKEKHPIIREILYSTDDAYTFTVCFIFGNSKRFSDGCSLSRIVTRIDDFCNELKEKLRKELGL